MIKTYEHKNVISELGKIYIGDPFVALKGLAISAWKEKFNLESGVFRFNNFNFSACNTEFNNGYFSGSDGNIYHISNGILAIIPFELVDEEKDYKNYGTVIDSREAVLSYEVCGDAIITYIDNLGENRNIIIQTGLKEDEEYDNFEDSIF